MEKRRNDPFVLVSDSLQLTCCSLQSGAPPPPKKSPLMAVTEAFLLTQRQALPTFSSFIRSVIRFREISGAGS